MKLTNARGSKLVRLGPDDVVNDFANPIQIVTLTADNAWHDFDWSGYEIHMLGTSSPLTYVKVNFSNADDGVVLVPGKPLKVTSGFSSVRMFLGFVDAGSVVRLAITKVNGIYLASQQPAPRMYTYVSNFTDSQILIDTGALPPGLYNFDYRWGANVSVNAGLRTQHRNAANTVSIYDWFVYQAISPSMSKGVALENILIAENERLRIVGSDTPAVHMSSILALLTRVG